MFRAHPPEQMAVVSQVYSLVHFVRVVPVVISVSSGSDLRSAAGEPAEPFPS